MPPNDPNQQTTPSQQPAAGGFTPQAPTTPSAQMPGSSVNPGQQQNQQPPQPQQDTPNYDFIVNPTEQPKPKPFENTKMPVKIAMIGGCLIVLLIAFNVIRGFVAGPSVGEKFLPIAQDQQQIITIATAAGKQQGLSTVNANSAATTQLGVATDQNDTVEYMTENGKKTKAKDLSLMLDAKVLEQLEASAAAGTYNETYKTIMSQQLEAYMNNMAQLYKQIDGKNGKALLDQNYKSAKLLLQQLQAT